MTDLPTTLPLSALAGRYPNALLILEPSPAELRRLADEMEGKSGGQVVDWTWSRGGQSPACTPIAVFERDGVTAHVWRHGRRWRSDYGFGLSGHTDWPGVCAYLGIPTDSAMPDFLEA